MMGQKQKSAVGWRLFVLALMMTVSGCAAAAKSAVVQPGEEVRFHFVCRFDNGEIAAASAETVNRDETLKKSNVFKPREKFDAFTVTAGSVTGEMREQGEGWFEGEMILRIAEGVTGMRRGGNRIELKAGEINPSGGREVIQVARVRQRPKEMRTSVEEFRWLSKGKDPTAGETLTLYEEIPGRVESVKDDEVLVVFPAVPGDEVQTPFGRGVIRDAGTQYDVVIIAQRGGLVRSGNLVGRIVAVDDSLITIDYTHPFGGESLVCDVDVEAPQEKK